MTAKTARPEVERTSRSPGKILPQRVGSTLWAPALIIALFGFAAGTAVSWSLASELAATEVDAQAVATLKHLDRGFMFLGFTAVFTAISFAIARILGELRAGGGDLQEAVGSGVETLRMPATGRVFILGMAMAMITLLAAVVLHFLAASAIASGSSSALESSDQWAIWLQAVRRIAVAVYLVAILFGLATITTVIRFQARRIQELASQD